MNPTIEPRQQEDLLEELDLLARFILSVQNEDGEIPWSVGGKTDPWDLVESAMGLAISGYVDEARRAYEWLARHQLKDGSWYSSIRNGVVEDSTKESHFSAYPAVGVLHYYLITRDLSFLKRLWPTVKKGIEFALAMQAPTGEIAWARNKQGDIDHMSLLTGCSSIYLSLKCALVISALLRRFRHDWYHAWKKLEYAIVHLPHRFNMIKSRFSMDWYYPVLCGAMRGEEAKHRIDRGWEKFAVPGWGIRCVSDRPWVTMAETAELALTLISLEMREEGKMVLEWIKDKRYDDGAYWMGVTFPDMVIWPEEKTTWTAAAVILAYDALYEISPAGHLFHHAFWQQLEENKGSLAERFQALHP